MAQPPRHSGLDDSWDDAQVREAISDTMREVREALEGRLSISQNIDGEIVALQTRANWPQDVRLSRNSKPVAVLVGGAWTTADNAAVAVSSLGWTFDSGTLTISSMGGTSAGTEYLVNLVVVGG